MRGIDSTYSTDLNQVYVRVGVDIREEETVIHPSYGITIRKHRALVHSRKLTGTQRVRRYHHSSWFDHWYALDVTVDCVVDVTVDCMAYHLATSMQSLRCCYYSSF